MANVIFTSHKKEVEEAMDKALMTALETVGQVAEGNAIKEITEMIYNQPESPTYVRTGRLRNSLTHAVEPSEQAVYIGTNVEYAPYVHEGTSRMPPRRFLRAAVENYAEQYQKLFEEAMKNLK